MTSFLVFSEGENAVKHKNPIPVNVTNQKADARTLLIFIYFKSDFGVFCLFAAQMASSVCRIEADCSLINSPTL